MNFISNKKLIIVLFFYYFFINTFLLINYNGIYWDDYVLIGNSCKTIKNMFAQATGGLEYFVTFLHCSLLTLKDNVFFYRLLTFILYYLSGLLLFFSLKKVNFLTDYIRFLIVLFFLIVPLNSAKISLINFPYTLSLFIFLLAIFLFINYILNEKKSFFIRFLILLLFLLSFIFTASLLVFYYIIILIIIYYYIDKYQNFSITNIFKSIIFQYIDFLLLPIIYFYVKSTFFVPYGLYANYNKINLSIDLFKLFYICFKTSFVQPIYMSFLNSMNNWNVFLIIFIVNFFILKTLRLDKIELNFNKIIMLFILGVILFILAVFPYVSVGKIPKLENMWSRHQLLIPFGFSLLIVSIILIMFKIHRKIAFLIMNFLISLFLFQTMINYLNYEKDWFYQLSIQENMRNNAIIKNNNTFIYKIENQQFLANNRNIGFYQMNGFSKKIFHVDNKFFIESIRDFIVYSKYKNYPQYNFSNYSFKKRIVYIIIQLNYIPNKEFFILLKNYIFDKEKFYKNVKKYSHLYIKGIVYEK